MATHIVTGACGFIGSHLVDRLISLGHNVIGIDLPSANREFVKWHPNSRFQLIKADLSQSGGGAAASLAVLNFENVDMVFHFAANADVSEGFLYPERDIQMNTVATYNLLELMRGFGFKKIAFASTAAIYGNIGEDDKYYQFGIPEDCSIPPQTSLYGASKLACEGLIQAYCAGYGFHSYIFRLGSIIGERYSHGFIYNFYKQLRENPTNLYVAGGPIQQKSYLYVQDLIDVIIDRTLDRDGFYSQILTNLAHPNTITLNESIPIITRYLKLDPKINWSGKKFGWIGDSMNTKLDTRKLWNWKPKVSIPEGIILTLKWLQENPWIFDVRK